VKDGFRCPISGKPIFYNEFHEKVDKEKFRPILKILEQDNEERLDLLASPEQRSNLQNDRLWIQSTSFTSTVL